MPDKHRHDLIAGCQQGKVWENMGLTKDQKDGQSDPVNTEGWLEDAG